MAEASNTSGKASRNHYFALPEGTRLFEFEINSVLGSGGFGITYLATDTLLQEAVAIKEFLPSEIAVRATDSSVRAKSDDDHLTFQGALRSFLEEARLMARFRHPRIVQVRRFFELNGTGYIVLDLERGPTLKELLASDPPDEADLVRIISGILDGLETMHDRAILHRDLKPNNIIIRDDGDPVIIDFGAARNFQNRNSRSVTAIATSGYSPPEQYGVGGQQGPWTDFYALGAIGYCCIAGKAPQDSLQRLKSDPLVPAETIGAGRFGTKLLAIIDWMLRVEEADRPASVSAIREALISGNVPLRSLSATSHAVSLSQNANGQVLLAMEGENGEQSIEVSFYSSPPAAYAARLADGSIVWRKEPHYFLLQPFGSSDGLTTFSLDSYLAHSISAGASVALADRNGKFIGAVKWLDLQEKKPTVWRSSWAKQAIFVLILLGVVSVFGYYQRTLTRRAAALEYIQAQELAQAGYDRGALVNFIKNCSPQCSKGLMEEAQKRLLVLDTEDTKFRTSGEDEVLLQGYIDTCTACFYSDEAKIKIDQANFRRLEAELMSAGSVPSEIDSFLNRCGENCPQQLIDRARQKLDTLAARTRELSVAGYDPTALRRIVDRCSADCPTEVLAEARQRLALLVEEQARYEAAQDELDRLNGYLQTCKACVHRADATAKINAITYRRLQVRLEAAGTNLGAIEDFITSCGENCPRDLKSKASELAEFVRRSESELSQASYSRYALGKFLGKCGLKCPQNLIDEARLRVKILEDEAREYHEAAGQVSRLIYYVVNCRACEHRADARHDIEVLKAKNISGEEPSVDSQILIRNVQAELARLQCYAGPVDGVWGPASAGALRLFVRSAQTQLTSMSPTPELVAELKLISKPICPIPKVTGVRQKRPSKLKNASPPAQNGTCRVVDFYTYCD